MSEESLLHAMFAEGEISKLHKPGENPQTDPSLMEKHLQFTKGRVLTRFPPEPNGFLHIGHAKAININFGYAKVHNGDCYLRYDDTNPDAEEKRFFDTIKETVEWLGFKPWAITYSSDHFQKLYDLAVDLIRRDKAYVCHCTSEEIYIQRGGDKKGPRTECKHRSRAIEESFDEFERMKQGRYKEGEAVLRMKMDIQSGNPQFWDLAAYRIKFTPHYRTHDQWCIYPTYDYTHCLVDSFENITHSFCTLEFRQSRESYYWLIDALELYKPVQWESGRLNITNTVMSKRKLTQLVDLGHVNAWDDPRLFTIAALRRRGFPPEAINGFVQEVGITLSNTTMEVSRLENHVRKYLNDHAPRLMAILDPIKVTLHNLPEDYLEMIELPNNPRNEKAGTHTVPFTRTFFIDRDDFRETDVKGYFRLAPGKSVGLQRVESPVTYVSHRSDETTGEVLEIICKYENDVPFKKPKAYIHWIADCSAQGSPVTVEARLYEPLFMHANPSDQTILSGGFLTDLNPNSLTIKQGILEVGMLEWIHKGLDALNGNYVSSKDNDEMQHREASDVQMKAVEALKFQFVRTGYFCVDPDSDFTHKDPNEWRIVINKTVGLNEDVGKKTK